ncbi:hypothetical protein [Verrucosispora sp. TAA-831]|uniref:hypothetical protein n=1 Tax=Verrucosispora sp. TAA-831 TaxID=3422227 RepID=UPI003D6F9A80
MGVMGHGKTVAIAPILRQAAIEQAKTGTIAPALEEFLVAARDGRVTLMGAQWVIAANHEARVAIDAGLVAKVGDHDQARLKPTKAGRQALGRIFWDRISERMQVVQKAYRRGWGDATRASRPRSRPLWRRVLSFVSGVLLPPFFFLLGGAVVYVAMAQIGSGQ